jgi:hypothetical protein
MEEIDHSTHTCCPDKVAMRDKVHFGRKHLLGWKKTNEVGITIGRQARQYRETDAGLARTILDTSRVCLQGNDCVRRVFRKPWTAAQVS